MWIKNLKLDRVKGFHDSGLIEFSKGINLLVGANNSGKSTILRSLALLQPFPDNSGQQQRPAQLFAQKFLRSGEANFHISVAIEEPDGNKLIFAKNLIQDPNFTPKILFKGDKNNTVATFSIGGQPQTIQGQIIPQREPDNFIYPFFSRRKPIEFDEQVNLHAQESVEETLKNIYAKVDRIANPVFSEYEIFQKACMEIIGFKISSHASGSGKQAGLAVSRATHIPLDAMGEGVINLLGLVTHLLISEGKLFLIEELENDIHPKALKALLELIIKKSATNQFIISTHSNIVAKYLGGEPTAKMFSIKMELKNQIPTSTVEVIANEPFARIKVLEDLGYDLFDFELWKGYLILEESTAETIIRDFLIPQFFPKLKVQLKTIAASGNADVEPRFIDFLRLFVFIHTGASYKDRAWVVTDGDESGKSAIESLKKKFATWPDKHFRSFSQKQFENYYPNSFQHKAKEVLLLPNGADRQKRKGELVKEVVAWANNNIAEAKKEFQKSAAEVIQVLSEIEAKLS
jgi:AAA15 family ATPase/GTPase